MENSGACNSGPNGQPLGYDALMDVDQPSNSAPKETRIGLDSSMRFDQASSYIPGGQPVVQPDPSIGFTGLDQAINLIPNGPYLGEDPSMNFDPSLDPSFDFNTDFDFNMDLSNTDFSNMDFSNIDFSNVDCSNMITPPLSPPLDPSNVTFSNEPFIFNPLAAPATTEQEIISLHAQLPREYHVLAKAVDEGLHNILTLLNSALATPDKAPNTKSTEPTDSATNLTTNSTTTDTASCLSHLTPLMQTCHALQADGEKLCLADPGGYGVLCRTFQQVAYRFDLHRTSPELVFEDWFEVFVGMRERIGRMGRDGLFAVARGEGARRLGGGGGEGKGTGPEEMKSAKSGKSSSGGKGAVAKGEGKVKGEKKAGKGETAKWERDGDGRLIKR